jgi:hypothetical protein
MSEAMPTGVRPKAADISGTMTAGADRIAYW